MNARPDDLIIRFLLDELSDEERARVEQQFLSDSQFFEELLSAEDALMDQYLLKQLSEAQQERARTLFQSSARQRRELAFTRELIASLREEPPLEMEHASHAVEGSANKAQLVEDVTGARDRADFKFDQRRHLPLIHVGLKNLTSRLSWAGVAALLLVSIALVSWIFYHFSQKTDPQAARAVVDQGKLQEKEKLSEGERTEPKINEQTASEPQKRATPKERPLQQEKHESNSVVSILLTPATIERGGGDSKVFKLKTGARPVQLQLELDEGQRYSHYSVIISTFDGHQVWSKNSLDSSQIKKGKIILTLPSLHLGYDDYRVELKGLPEGGGQPVHVADYVFRIRD